MCERGRRTVGWIDLIPEVHACDETALHGEYVMNLAVRENIPLKTLDELVYLDAGPAYTFLGHRKWFDMGIELVPLSSPIGADLFLSDIVPAPTRNSMSASSPRRSPTDRQPSCFGLHCFRNLVGHPEWQSKGDQVNDLPAQFEQ